MAWKNISEGTMHLPSGRQVKPGSQFTTAQGEGLNLRALERGHVIRRTSKKKVKKKG